MLGTRCSLYAGLPAAQPFLPWRLGDATPWATHIQTITVCMELLSLFNVAPVTCV